MPLLIFLYLGGPGGPPQQGYQQPQHPGYPLTSQQPYPQSYPQPQGSSAYPQQAPYPFAQQNTPYPPSGLPGQPRDVSNSYFTVTA